MQDPSLTPLAMPVEGSAMPRGKHYARGPGMTSACDQDLTDLHGETAHMRAEVDRLREALARASLRLRLLGQVASPGRHAEVAHRWADQAAQAAREVGPAPEPSTGAHTHVGARHRSVHSQQQMTKGEPEATCANETRNGVIGSG